MKDYKEKFQLIAHTNAIRHWNFILIYIVIILISHAFYKNPVS